MLAAIRNTMSDLKAIYKKLEHARTEEEKVDALNDLAFDFMHKDIGRFERYTYEARELATKIGYTKGLSVVNLNLGCYHFWKSNLEGALEYFKQAKAQGEAMGDLLIEAQALDHMSPVYRIWGNLDKAQQIAEQALGLYEKSDETDGIECNCLNSLGNIHMRRGNYQQALKYYDKALGIMELNNWTMSTLTCRGNFALALSCLERYDEAEEMFKMLLKDLRELGHRTGEGMALVNLGDTYLKKNDLPDALQQFTEALRILKENPHRETEASAMNGLGNVYLKMKGYEEAIMKFEKALEILASTDYQEGKFAAYIGLAEACHYLGNARAAEEQLEYARTTVDDVEMVRDRLDLERVEKLINSADNKRSA